MKLAWSIARFSAGCRKEFFLDLQKEEISITSVIYNSTTPVTITNIIYCYTRMCGFLCVCMFSLRIFLPFFCHPLALWVLSEKEGVVSFRYLIYLWLAYSCLLPYHQTIRRIASFTRSAAMQY